MTATSTTAQRRATPRSYRDELAASTERTLAAGARRTSSCSDSCTWRRCWRRCRSCSFSGTC